MDQKLFILRWIIWMLNTLRPPRQPELPTSQLGSVPVSLILLFDSEHLSTLKVIAENKEAFSKNAALLMKYQWYWFGATQDADASVSGFEIQSKSDMCWLQINLRDYQDPAKEPDRLQITDLLNRIAEKPELIDKASADGHFRLMTSGINNKGYKKK